MNFYITNPYAVLAEPQPEKPLKRGSRWIWRTSQGPYIRAKHGPIGVELDLINQQKEQQNG